MRRWNIWDITFDPVRTIPVGGGLVIEFTTHNELDDLFEIDLGLGMEPLTLEREISCMVQQGFNGISAGIIRCKVVKSVGLHIDTPAKVYV